jgi:zinc transport system substrate-binding protein
MSVSEAGSGLRRACRAAAALCAGIGLLLGGCGKGKQASGAKNAGSGEVVTSCYPVTFFAERIAGDKVPVECLLPPEEDPIFWRPSTEVIERMQRASLVVLNGAEFEQWALTTSLPDSRVVRSAEGFKDAWLRFETVKHAHGPGGAHTHEGTDGHTWLDPRLAMAQADRIAQSMTAAFPVHGATFASGLARLKQDLEELEATLEGLRPGLQGVVILASHPAYNYISQRFGWNVRNLDLDPEGELTDADLASVGSKLGEGAGRRVMLWESEPRPATIERLREQFGIESVVFSPVEQRPERGEDYLDVMKGNIARLAAAVGAGG